VSSIYYLYDYYGSVYFGREKRKRGTAVETAADDLVQLLNVVFGNISIKPGIRVEALTLPREITARFRGPVSA
jgi:hypothetical protein